MFPEQLHGKEALKEIEKARVAEEEAESKIFHKHKRHLRRLQKEKVQKKRDQSTKTAAKLLGELECTIAAENAEYEQRFIKRYFI